MNDTMINGIRLRFVTGRMVGVKEIGHVCFCRPLDGERPGGISCVANTGGFVPCTAVGNFLGVRKSCLEGAVTECNQSQEVRVFMPCERGIRLHGANAHTATPSLILTPRPRNFRVFDEDAARRLMAEVLAVSDEHQIRILRMVQFCMLFDPLPRHHLRGVRLAIEEYAGPSSLQEIVFDLDERHASALYAVFTD